MLYRAAAVANMNHRRLRKSGQQLMGRLSGKDRRAAAVIILRVAVHGKAFGIKRVEPRITIPGFVKMQPVAAFAEQFLNPADIVAQTVISRVGNNGMNRLRVYPLADQSIVGNGFLHGLPSHPRGMNRADDAVAVAGRNQVSRNGAGHGNRLFNRLVTVAVAERHLIADDAGHENNPV